MYLSRLSLNPADRLLRRNLGDLQALHRTVMSGFVESPDGPPRATLGILWRIEPDDRDGRVALVVQSQASPDWSSLPAGYLVRAADTKSIDAALAALAPGMRLRFRLLANPTRKIDTKSSPDGARRNGRRVPLRTDDELLGWLIRQADRAGFEVGPDAGAVARRVVVRRLADAKGRRPAGAAPVTLRGVIFDGRLTVTDAERLRLAVANGVGPGKAFGFGLLSLATA